MIIALAGKGASGKSTVVKMLVDKLKFKHYSIGDLMREQAKEKNVTILRLNQMAETDASIDKWLDERQEQLGKTEDNFIIDSRIAFKFIPHAIKIMLDVDDDIAAHRIFIAPPRDGENEYKSEDDAKKNPILRRESEISRLKRYYCVNPYDKKNYDLVIDTSYITPEKVVDKILIYLKKRKVL